MTDLLTEEKIVIGLAARCTKRGEQQRMAQQLGISQATLSNVLTGGRTIGSDLAERLGFRRLVLFEPIVD